MKLLAICGYSGSGKTMLLKQLIPLLKQQGLKIGVIKHSHHNVEIDTPGKDSYELRKSGADQTIIASDRRWALITETARSPADLDELAKKFTDIDLVLLEGFKDETITKIICHRSETRKPLYIDNMTIAVASDMSIDINIPILNINNIEDIKQFICHWFVFS